jgi:CRISPR-associated protein (TIGR02584 family)
LGNNTQELRAETFMKKGASTKNNPEPTPEPGLAPTVKPQVVLLAVTGMTPAVLTETVWALADGKSPVIPDRVVAVTTPKGRDLMEHDLFGPAGAGADNLWQTLRREILGAGYQTDVRLSHEYQIISAHNARSGRKEPLEDFRTFEANAAMADFVLEQVRGFVESPGIQLITSIAGGRKTLGALLYACMSLLGRETDRLTHVLVNEPFDSFSLTPKFFFPKQPEQTLKNGDGTMVTAIDGHIDLADIPFVPLRNLFERELTRKPYTFTELVARCRNQVNQVAGRNVKLTILRGRREITVNGQRVQTSHFQQVLLLFLGDKSNAAALAKITKFTDAVEPLKAYANQLYAKRDPNDFNDWRGDSRLPGDFDDQYLRRSLNELKEKLRAAGKEVEPLIQALPERGRFSLDLPPTAITLHD